MIIFIDVPNLVYLGARWVAVREAIETDVSLPIPYPGFEISRLAFDRLAPDLRDSVSVIANCKVVLELMEAQLHGLAVIRQQRHGMLPFTAAGFLLQRLRFCYNLFVSAPSPETLVVVSAARLIGLIRFHLRFSEILHGG